MLRIGGDKGVSIAIINSGINKGKIIRVESIKPNSIEISDEIKQLKGMTYNERSIELKDGMFSPYPNDEKDAERQVLYIAGPSGSGKSTYMANYIKNWHKINKKRDIVIVSKVDKDKALTTLKLNLKKIPIDEDLIENPIDIENDLKNTMVVFDDINTIKDKNLKAEVNHLQDDILEIGRHHCIDVISTNHKLMDYNNTRTLLNEAHFVTFFLNGIPRHTRRFLKEYFGADESEIKKIMKLKSRWVTVHIHVPRFCISETEIFLL